jgi:hypothetical protein
MRNEYLVRNICKTLRTAVPSDDLKDKDKKRGPAHWDDLNDDNKWMISRLLKENMRERLRRTRLLEYVYSGVMDEEDRVALLQGIADWYEDDPESRQASRQMIESRLRTVFDALFRPDEEDKVNLSAQAWAQVAFHIKQDPTEGYGNYLRKITAESTDKLHEICIEFIVIRSKSRVIVTYFGPQRFKTFKGALGSELRQKN